MAIVTRYFDNTGAGAADGTTWADRAALFSAGNWSTVITGFSFAGTDSLEVRIQGGITYSFSQSMAVTLFANPPTAANPIIFHGCDSSGNLLEPPDPDWVSAQAPFSTSTLPILGTTSNIASNSVPNSFWRLIAFTSSARISGGAFSTGNYDWVHLTNTTANTSAGGFNAPTSLTNSFVHMNSASFSYGIIASGINSLRNIRLDGTAGVTSGNRTGVDSSTGGYEIDGSTIIGFAGGGLEGPGSSTTRSAYISHCTIVNNGTYGVLGNATASQTVWHVITNCYFSGNTYGIDGNGARIIASNNRLRDSTSGNFANMGNYPDTYNYTTDSDDATEFVNSGAGDYRIKNTATNVWGKGYGAGDEPASGGGAGIARLTGGGLVHA